MMIVPWHSNLLVGEENGVIAESVKKKEINYAVI